MLRGNMVRVGHEGMSPTGDGVGGDDLPASHDSERGAGDLHIDVLASEGVGHRVLHRGDLHVVIPVDLGLLPDDWLPAGLGKVEQFRLLVLGEQLPAAGLLAAERGPVVDRLHLGGDRVVRIVQAREAPIGQASNHPVRHHFHSGLDVPEYSSHWGPPVLPPGASGRDREYCAWGPAVAPVGATRF